MKRSHRIMISVTEQEYRDLEKGAGSEPVSGFVYQLIRRALQRRRRQLGSKR